MAVIMQDAAYMGFPLSIKRGNPAPVDTTAVWYNKVDLESYAKTGATAYVGQILTLVADGKTEAYLISNEAGTLVKLASTTASGDLSSDVAILQTEVADLISKVGEDGDEATGLYAKIAEIKALAETKVASVAAGDASIKIGGSTTAPTVAAQVSAAAGNSLSLKTDGLFVEVPEITHPEYSIVQDENSGSYSAIYHLTKDGVNVGAAINIPKDMVVKSGSVQTYESGSLPSGVSEAGTYIVLVLANATNDKLYIKVDDLIEYVTSGSAESDMVFVNVDPLTHKVTATITDGTITKAKLATAVQSSLDKADSAVQEIKSGSADGTIAVDGSDVSVKGLKSAAFITVDSLNTTAKGYADAAKSEVLGNAETDTAESATIEGAKKYADSKTTTALNDAKKYTDDSIKGLDVTDEAVTGQFVSSVSQVDGKISVSRKALVASDIPELAISKVSGLQDALDAKQNSLTFNTAYNASTNKVATMTDVGNASSNLIGTSKDESSANTIYGAKKYAEEKASAAESAAKAASKTITDDLNTRLSDVEGAISGAGSIADSINKAKEDAIAAAKTETEGQVSAAKTELEEKITAAQTAADSKATLDEVKALGYATKTYVDDQDNGLKGTSKDTATVVSIYGARALAQQGVDAAAAAKTAADNYNTALTTTISNTKSDLLGSTEDDSTKETIRGARKLAQSEAAAVLGDSSNTATNKTVYGAFAAAKAAQDKADSNETAIGTDTTVGTVKYRVKTLETSVAKNTTDIAKNAADIATITGNMTGVFHFKGGATKTGSELYVDGAQVVEKAVGDVYTVGEEEYAWSGSEWIMLGITTDLSNYYNKSDVDKKISGFSGAFHFKGVATKFDNVGAPIVSNPSEGDVWLDADNAQWAWNGEQWIKLGFLTDLTGYATLVEVDEKIKGALNGLYTFKGEVESLDSVVSPLRGDVYVVPQADGSKKQYAYAGDGNWVEISTNVDLSSYALTTAVDEKIRVAKNEVISTAAADALAKANSAKADAIAAVDELKGEATKDVGTIQTEVEGLKPLVTQNTNSITTINTSLADSGSVGKRIKANEDAITKLNGDKDTDGSIDNKIATAVAEVTAATTNVIEKIQVNGEDLSVGSSKEVNIPLATAARAGLIKSSTAENAVSVDTSTGVATVNSLNVSKLVQTEGDELILNGGKA